MSPPDDRGDPGQRAPHKPGAHPVGEHRTEALLAQQDVADIDRWVGLFAQLGDATRLRILLALHRAPGITVTDLADGVGLGANTVSHALASLTARGLAASTRDGRWRRWSLIDDELHAILHALGAGHSELHPEHELGQPMTHAEALAMRGAGAIDDVPADTRPSDTPHGR